MTHTTANHTFVRRGAVLALVALALAVPGRAHAGVRVWFSQAGKPVAVTRGGSTIEQAVQQLLAGPTASERGGGLSSAIPAATPLNGVSIRFRVVTVDLGARFAAGRDETSLRARVAQLVLTLRTISGVRSVKVLIDGGVPVGIFPGYDLRRPVTAPIDTTPRPVTTRDNQQKLVDLGFMAAGGVTGSVDTQTSVAVLGFQKWAGLERDGSLGTSTLAALARATRPEPAHRADGRRIEVQLRRQLALLIENDRVVRAVHISSGAGGKTPVGSFRVYRKERYSWSQPFKVWLPWASYFTGGVAFHEFGSVPAYAASHGCIRVNHYDAALLFGFAEQGTPVDVFDEAAL